MFGKKKKNPPFYVDLAYGRPVCFFFTRLFLLNIWLVNIKLNCGKYSTVFIAMCFGRGVESICFKLLRYCFNPAGEHVALPGSYFRVCMWARTKLSPGAVPAGTVSAAVAYSKYSLSPSAFSGRFSSSFVEIYTQSYSCPHSLLYIYSIWRFADINAFRVVVYSCRVILLLFEMSTAVDIFFPQALCASARKDTSVNRRGDSQEAVLRGNMWVMQPRALADKCLQNWIWTWGTRQKLGNKQTILAVLWLLSMIVLLDGTFRQRRKMFDVFCHLVGYVVASESLLI